MQKKLKSWLLRFKLMLPSPAHFKFAEQVLPFSPQHLPWRTSKQQHLLKQANMSLKVSPCIKGMTERKQTQESIENVRRCQVKQKHASRVLHSICPGSWHVKAGPEGWAEQPALSFLCPHTLLLWTLLFSACLRPPQEGLDPSPTPSSTIIWSLPPRIIRRKEKMKDKTRSWCWNRRINSNHG